jgi:hypothetical protein
MQQTLKHACMYVCIVGWLRKISPPHKRIHANTSVTVTVTVPVNQPYDYPGPIIQGNRYASV